MTKSIPLLKISVFSCPPNTDEVAFPSVAGLCANNRIGAPLHQGNYAGSS